MFVKITTTPSTISVKDSDNNRLTVVRTSTGIEYHSTLNDNKASNRMYALQTQIERHILAKSKDNYKVRFEKLAKVLNKIETHSFTVLKNTLVKG